MYRVVLIDDENIILEGLSRVINWEDYHLQVVGTAGDGKEGAEIIRRLQPNILITDINMPGCDGLSMVAGLRSEFPDMQVSVLTGYRDFAYAQEAIRLGVTRFLLKPSKLDDIKEALETMVSRLDKLPPEKLGEEQGVANSFIVNQAISYMQDNYAQKLTLQTVADSCYVSQWHLSKLLNKYAGKSFSDILNSIRIEQAKLLLAQPQHKVSNVGELVGYSDSAHFARSFKKIAGMSANEYRNSLRN